MDYEEAKKIAEDIVSRGYPNISSFEDARDIVSSAVDKLLPEGKPIAVEPRELTSYLMFALVCLGNHIRENKPGGIDQEDLQYLLTIASVIGKAAFTDIHALQTLHRENLQKYGCLTVDRLMEHFKTVDELTEEEEDIKNLLEKAVSELLKHSNIKIIHLGKHPPEENKN